MTARSRASQALGDHSPGISSTLIVLVALGGSIFLTWHGDLDGQAFVALVSAIIGGVLVRGGVASGSKATADPPPSE